MIYNYSHLLRRSLHTSVTCNRNVSGLLVYSNEMLSKCKRASAVRRQVEAVRQALIALYSGESHGTGRPIGGHPRGRLTYANLAEKPAWDTHYKRSPTSFDWLLSYDQMELALAPFLQGKVGQQVLDIGSGTSDLALRLATHYPCFVHCLDFSQGALAAAARTYRVAAAGGASSNSVAGALTFTAADAARLPYVDGCFHLVTDKGTSDSVLKDAGGGRALALRMFGECARVLTPGGSLLMFTDEDPEMRLPLLEDFAKTTRGGGASVRFSLLGERNGLEYFMYELRKS